VKIGEVIRVSTNAELLNELLGKNYGGWMKSVYDFGDKRIWMIHIDNKHRNGWKNYKKGDVIVEENMRSYDKTGLRTDVRHNIVRVVFSKHEGYFIFEGLYKYDEENSRDAGIRYWIKVSDEF
jgi:hypothetical protein